MTKEDKIHHVDLLIEARIGAAGVDEGVVHRRIGTVQGDELQALVIGGSGERHDRLEGERVHALGSVQRDPRTTAFDFVKNGLEIHRRVLCC